MQNQASPAPKIVLETPRRRRPISKWLTILAGAAAVIGLTWAWQTGLGSNLTLFAKPIELGLVEVDNGDIVQLVIENGTLESASDATVKCTVEAIMGLTGGASATGGTSKTAGANGQSTTTAAATATPKAAATVSTKASTTKSKAATATASKSASSSGGSSSATAAATTATTGTAKPVIRSFTYTVARHTPLKSTATKSASTSASAASKSSGGGSGGRSSRGGRGNTGQPEEKPGSTRILSILPEGTKVSKGDIVCELDSASFAEELKAQKIRHLQAKAWVEQAKAILEVNEITLREYRDGIYPQDLELIRHYINSCQIEYDIAARNFVWSTEMTKKGLRARSQLIADDLAVKQAEIALQEAKGMLLRLEKFTGPKILKSLEAKLAAILTDKLAQDSSFALETERLNRLEKNIAACTLRAPDDGVVVYVNQTNGWGRVESAIEEGVTVRQDQPIFQLPDPRRLRVKARINETKVAQIHSGQRCRVVIDAFPDRMINGTVTDVTAIATPVNGPFSDVRVYFALIRLDRGFDDLRPGLSAEVIFLNDQRVQVDRLPIATVREVDGESFVAVPDRSPTASPSAPYQWRKVELGLRGPDFVEVLSGVRQGDQVVADPLALEAPKTTTASAPVASLSP